MRQFGYYVLKGCVSFGLFFYYRKIRVIGIENVPKEKPVLFLSNHQNALLDIFLIATRSGRKPWYLTRGDVFRSKLFRPLFSFLQMLPIFRIRDGRDSLSKNQAIFDQCGQLLAKGEAILIFPEANHSLRRRVRPLSKGFTRIIENALEKDPNLDIQLIPIGQNYQTPTSIGDSAALYFGKAIAVKDYWSNPHKIESLKQAVYNTLCQLTTHIEDVENYDSILAKLNTYSTSFLFPREINQALENSNFEQVKEFKTNPFSKASKAIFFLLNFPMIVLWRLVLKPKVPEPEFMATFRFGFAFIEYPLFYAFLLLMLQSQFNLKTALVIGIGHAVLNLFLVKIGLTSSHQRK